LNAIFEATRLALFPVLDRYDTPVVLLALVELLLKVAAPEKALVFLLII
jgi:hypothetical protein